MGNYLGNPNLKLTGVEYLCLCMQANPGRSKRYYLRRKNIYQRGSDPSKGANGSSGYFRPGTFYDDNLWEDWSFAHNLYGRRRKDWMGRTRYQPKSCQMHLTRKGWTKANEARKKLGLESLPYNND
tara:strand:+ start:1063 stop:1440 length:378 start_codon:yes stop_codon:yes gene_type:complete